MEARCIRSRLDGCHVFETGGTFNPSVRNGWDLATGLIQFI